MYYVCTYKLGVMAHKTVSNDESHYTVWTGGISVAVRVRDRVGIDFILQNLASPSHSQRIGAGFETSDLDSTPPPCTPLFQTSGKNTENLAPPGIPLCVPRAQEGTSN